MTVTIDWGAVAALLGIGGVLIVIMKLFVRDEIRKVTNGHFELIDRRLGSLEIAVNVLETEAGISHRVNFNPSHGDVR